MTGYEKSPDYGGPGKVNWRTVITMVVMLSMIIAAFVLSPNK